MSSTTIQAHMRICIGSAEVRVVAVDMLRRVVVELNPMIFDGVKVHVMKPLSNHFQVAHTLNLSQMANAYKFAVTYVGTKETAPHEVCMRSSSVHIRVLYAGISCPHRRHRLRRQCVGKYHTPIHTASARQIASTGTRENNITLRHSSWRCR